VYFWHDDLTTLPLYTEAKQKALILPVPAMVVSKVCAISGSEALPALWRWRLQVHGIIVKRREEFIGVEE
jgi:hypothetical protein